MLDRLYAQTKASIEIKRKYDLEAPNFVQIGWIFQENGENVPKFCTFGCFSKKWFSDWPIFSEIPLLSNTTILCFWRNLQLSIWVDYPWYHKSGCQVELSTPTYQSHSIKLEMSLPPVTWMWSTYSMLNFILIIPWWCEGKKKLFYGREQIFRFGRIIFLFLFFFFFIFSNI